jgi:uncharacterized protein (TIGR03437 family)
VILRVRFALLLAILGGAVAVAADGTVAVQVFSTGTNASNGKDMKYTIVSDATEGTSGPAAVVTKAPPPPPDGWGAVPGGSGWIAPAADQTNATRPGNKFVGVTIYHTTFSLHGLEPTSATLTMSILADDWVDVYLNPGPDSTKPLNHIYAPSAQMYQIPVQVTYHGNAFVAEDNVLEFRVNNAGGGPTGLNVAIRGTAEPLQAGPPVLDVSPAFLEMTAPQGTPFSQSDAVGIWIRNAGGGGPQSLQFSLAGSPQCQSINVPAFFALSPPSATSQLTPAMVLRGFATNPANIAVNPGYYRANLHLTSGSLAQDICMNFLLTNSQPGFSVSKTGLSFSAQVNTGTGRTQTIPIFTGGSQVNWTASILSQNDFLTVTPMSGTSNAPPGTVTGNGSLAVGVKPMSAAGTYYGVIEVTPDPSSGQTPVLVAAVYNVMADAPPPEMSSAGLVFVMTPGVTTPPQNLVLYPSTSGSQSFTLNTTGGFVTLTNTTGSLGGASPATIPVSVNTGNLYQGLNQGTIQVNGRSVHVTAILLPPGAKISAPATTGCAPSAIAVVGTTIADNFSLSVGWPAVYQARVLDDCANPVTNASVVLHFSNGDPDLRASLEDARTGTYTATWAPAQAGAVTVTARASAGSFAAATAIAGVVTASNAPTIAPHGTVHNFNPQPGTALAPGTMANVTGSGLATTTDMFTQFPLPTSMDGTQVTVAGTNVPIYAVDAGQIGVQIPVELATNAIYPVVVTVNGAVTAVDTVWITDVSPGIATNADGTLAAQHLDTTPVTADNPALPGESINLFGSGFGITSPAVATNVGAPADEPLARVVNPVSVTVDGNAAVIGYAGLAPGGIGLYEVTFTVPPGVNPGSLNVIVSQNGVNSNAALLPVAAPPQSDALRRPE